MFKMMLKLPFKHQHIELCGCFFFNSLPIFLSNRINDGGSREAGEGGHSNVKERREGVRVYVTRRVGSHKVEKSF